MVEGVHRRSSRGRAEYGDQAGHAEGQPDLPAHGVEGGAGGGALGWQRCGGGAAERRQHEADPDTSRDAAGQVGADVIGAHPHAGDPPEGRSGEDQAADGAHGPMAEPRPEEPGREGAEGRQERPGCDHEARPQHRLVPDPGEEEDSAQDQGAESGEEDQRAEVGQGDSAVTDDGRLNDRVGVAARPHHQQSAGHDGEREGPEDGGARPAPVRPLDNGGGQAGHGNRKEGRTQQVCFMRGGVLYLPQHAYPNHQGDEAEGQVHQEDPTPAGLHQDPADRRPEGGGGSPDG